MINLRPKEESESDEDYFLYADNELSRWLITSGGTSENLSDFRVYLDGSSVRSQFSEKLKQSTFQLNSAPLRGQFTLEYFDLKHERLSRKEISESDDEMPKEDSKPESESLPEEKLPEAQVLI